MKKFSFILLALTVLFSAEESLAQNKRDLSDPLVEVFKSSVKSVDEFMQRFNAKEFHPGLDKNNPEHYIYNFAAVFNSELGGKDGFGNEEFMNDVRKIYDNVVDSGVRLSFDSKYWYARQDIIFTKKGGQKVNLSIILQTDSTDTGLPYWSIVGVDGVKNLMPNDTLKRLVISPEQNEMDFQELYSAFEFNKKDFSRFLSDKLVLDPVSYFMALIENEVLKFDKIEELTYYFFDVPEYILKVEYVDRLTANSGWLITEFMECDNQSKNDFKSKILGK